jgi:hypothetical protein
MKPDFKEAAEKWIEDNNPVPLPHPCTQAFISGAKAGYIEAMKEQRWIPVSERLPELFKNVLIFGSQGTTAISCVDADLSIDLYPLKEGEKVTHWQPLPPPPSFTEQSR